MSFPLQQGGGSLGRPPKLRRTWVSSAAELPTLSTFSNPNNEAPGSRRERDSPSQRLPYLSTAQISYARGTQGAVFDNPFSCFPRSPRAPKSPGTPASVSGSPQDPTTQATDFEELSAVLRRIPSSNRVFAGGLAGSPSITTRSDSNHSSGWTAAFRSRSRPRSRTNSITGPDAEGVPSDLDSHRPAESRASTSSRRPRTSDGAIARGSLAISITDRFHVTAIDLDPAWSCSDSEQSHQSHRSSISSSVAAPIAIPDLSDRHRDSVGSLVRAEFQAAESEFEGEEWLANPDDSLERREQGYGNRRSWSTASLAGNPGSTALSNSFSSNMGMPVISSTTSVNSMNVGDRPFRPVIISRSMTSDSFLNLHDTNSYTQISSPGTVKQRKKRRPQSTDGPGGVPSTPKSPKIGKKFLSFLKEKASANPAPSPASSMPPPVFPSSPVTGSMSRGHCPEVRIRPSTSQGTHASATHSAIAPPRSSVSSSETTAGLTAESVSGSSVTSAPLTSQSSLSIPTTHRASVQNLHKPSSIQLRPTSVRSNSASSEQLGLPRLSGSQTRSSDSANSNRSLPRSFRRGSTPGDAHPHHKAYSKAGNEQIRKAVAAADQAYAAMFPYESRSRTMSDARDSSPVQAQSLQHHRTGSGNPYRSNMPSLLRASSSGHSNHSTHMRPVMPGLRDVLSPPVVSTPTLGRSSTSGVRGSSTADPALDIAHQSQTMDGSRVPDNPREVPRSSSKKRGLAGRLSSWLEKI
ncbi:hypothetical protein OC846_002624 [Tilletia horrida]|uniref:Uncharacterized protein n=1 Tax=Tilletia horrida TaxID=155126 RepID=A0AAN6JSG3_9BASI|nr:hypothetical protein OC846_002624 [Tilletia horrida]KAK0564719.1 hypothetical protein OC861_004136 [Tilletia horrida]